MLYTIDQIREITAPIAERYGLKRLSLFGSYARGEATEDSDIDIIVDRGDMRGGLIMGGLYYDLCESLGKELDMVTTKSIDGRIREKILEDEVILYDKRA